MKKYRFFDEVHDFQRFVRENIKLIGNYIIISEQLYVKNNETGIIDMLVIDNDDRRLTVVELKNEVTTDKNVWQPLRYYDLLRRGEDDLKELLLNASHKISYDINQINLNPKLVLVVPKCNYQLLRTLSYFEDIDSKVVELTRYSSNLGIQITKQVYYPTSVFHKDDLVSINQKISKIWNFNEYINHGINSEKINLAKRMIEQIKNLFLNKGYQFDTFFNETKITITKNGKVWSHIFIKQKPLDYKLVMSFKIPKDTVVNQSDFMYNPSIEKFDIKKGSIKITLNNCIPSQLIEKYL